MSKILVDTIDTRSGTSNITIGSSNASQITLKSGATLTNFPANTPNFFANKTNDQTISSGSATKVEFNTEEFDSDGAFASDRFTVPSGQAGKYFFYTTCHFTGSTDQSYHIVEFFKNGSVAARSVNRFSGTPSLSESLSIILDLSASDYVEVYVKQNSGSGQILRGEASERKTYFIGYKLT
jgi:hypothetical protein